MSNDYQLVGILAMFMPPVTRVGRKLSGSTRGAARHRSECSSPGVKACCGDKILGRALNALEPGRQHGAVGAREVDEHEADLALVAARRRELPPDHDGRQQELFAALAQSDN